MDILQGERDYRVTMIDFAGYADALERYSNVTLKSYPNLNHFFISRTGKSTPVENKKTGNVDRTGIEDIAGWIKG